MGLQQGPLGRLITTKKQGHVDGVQTKVTKLQRFQATKTASSKEAITRQ
jgi:hypothetical protein